MVRSALQSNKRIGQGPVPAADLVPAATVLVVTLLCALPIVVQRGWFPDFGFMMLITWRLRRPDVWPAWWAAILGFANDLFSGSPIGLSVTVWTAAMLACDFADRRILWRDYWIEWALAALLITMAEAAHWQAAAWTGAKLPFSAVVPALLISIAAFPLFAWTVALLDRWRFRRK
jgi:rod shape-determining protein MreD